VGGGGKEKGELGFAWKVSVFISIFEKRLRVNKSIVLSLQQ
jgi:hypothetical protein